MRNHAAALKNIILRRKFKYAIPNYDKLTANREFPKNKNKF